MQVQENKVVGIHYTLKNDSGDVLDSSEGREPLQFLHGKGNIINGLEKALEGKSSGDTVEVTVEPEEGYGQYREELVQDVPKSAFQGVDDLQVGMRFQAQTEQGALPIKIKSIQEDTVTVDGNHELAGKRLHFNVSVENVRNATEEEKSHGHVHE